MKTAEEEMTRKRERKWVRKGRNEAEEGRERWER